MKIMIWRTITAPHSPWRFTHKRLFLLYLLFISCNKWMLNDCNKIYYCESPIIVPLRINDKTAEHFRYNEPLTHTHAHLELQLYPVELLFMTYIVFTMHLLWYLIFFLFFHSFVPTVIINKLLIIFHLFVYAFSASFSLDCLYTTAQFTQLW